MRIWVAILVTKKRKRPFSSLQEDDPEGDKAPLISTLKRNMRRSKHHALCRAMREKPIAEILHETPVRCRDQRVRWWSRTRIITKMWMDSSLSLQEALSPITRYIYNSKCGSYICNSELKCWSHICISQDRCGSHICTPTISPEAKILASKAPIHTTLASSEAHSLVKMARQICKQFTRGS